MEIETDVKFNPTPSDVILTKKRKWLDHSGNLEYERLIDTYRPRMLQPKAPSKEDINAMVKEIIEVIVHQQHGRFIVPNDLHEDYCVVLSKTKYEQKVETKLRAIRNTISLRQTKAAPAGIATQKHDQQQQKVHRKSSSHTKKRKSHETASLVSVDSPNAKRRRSRPPKKVKSQQLPIPAPAPGATYSQALVVHNDSDEEDDDDSVSTASRETKPSLQPLVRRRSAVSSVKSSKKHKKRNKNKDWTDNTLYSGGTKRTLPAVVVSSFATTTPPTTTSTATTTTRPTTGLKSWINPATAKVYGTPEDELAMRRWLNTHKLPQSVGDVLVSEGARDVDDVALLLEANCDKLKHLPKLDFVKLQKAVQSKKNDCHYI